MALSKGFHSGHGVNTTEVSGDKNKKGQGRDLSEIVCYRCKNKGHYAVKGPNKEPNN